MLDILSNILTPAVNNKFLYIMSRYIVVSVVQSVILVY